MNTEKNTRLHTSDFVFFSKGRIWDNYYRNIMKSIIVYNINFILPETGSWIKNHLQLQKIC